MARVVMLHPALHHQVKEFTHEPVNSWGCLALSKNPYLSWKNKTPANVLLSQVGVGEQTGCESLGCPVIDTWAVHCCKALGRCLCTSLEPRAAWLFRTILSPIQLREGGSGLWPHRCSP